MLSFAEKSLCSPGRTSEKLIDEYCEDEVNPQERSSFGATVDLTGQVVRETRPKTVLRGGTEYTGEWDVSTNTPDGVGTANFPDTG